MRFAAFLAVSLACGIAGSDTAFGQDVRVGDEASTGTTSPKVRVVFHQGAVLGIGEDSLLTYVPDSGTIIVQYADGHTVEGFVNPSPESALGTDPAWVFRGALVGLRGSLPKAGCSSELDSLNAAIASVQASCRAGAGQTPVCTSARSTLEHAYSDYNECVSRLIQQK